jgi:class 3 adenylate cyclase
MSQAIILSILEELKSKTASAFSLLNRYRSHDNLALWQANVVLYRRFGKRLLEQGNPGPALELVREGLKEDQHPKDPELCYLEALALSRCGNVHRTQERITTLLRRGDLPPQVQSEALALYGRTWKDRFERARTDAERIAMARESADAYEQAYKLGGDPFPGVNAATMARLAGDVQRSERIAAESLEQARAQVDAAGKAAHYWLHACLGEAHLLLGDLEAARGQYRRAVQSAGNDYGSIARMRHQLQLLKKVLPAAERLLDLFHVGTVIAFAGHRIDDPRESTGHVRFPPSPELEQEVRRAVRHELDNLDAVVGFCCPSSGADLLFAELMMERGAEVHLVLPFALEDFLHHRVDYGRPELADWRRRCQAILDAAGRNEAVHYAIREEFLEDQLLFDFSNTFMQGLALARARQVGAAARALVVLDSQFGRESGTERFVRRWQSVTTEEPRVLDLAALRARVNLTSTSTTPPSPQPAPVRENKRHVKAMLFADLKNFSKLPERKAPEFFLAFLRQVSRVIEQSPVRPCFKNTWGDGLFIVMDTVRDCADFALRLIDELGTVDWTALGLPSDTGIRIGLHTGPVFQGKDPIIDRESYFGSHVSRAARIEPVTAPGSAFASEQFAASLAMEAPSEFVCEYLGIHDLAKGYDRCPLYCLLRQRP